MPESQRPFAFERLDLTNVATPVHITDEVSLEKNLKLLASIYQRSGAKILLALKAFAQFSLFSLVDRYLQGATSSSLFEARLARETMNGEVHICAPAYPPDDFAEILECVDHVVFNSFSQWKLFRTQISSCQRKVEIGMRINPEHSEVQTQLYDPCAHGSRLGVRLSDFPKGNTDLDNMDGLHLHTLCELGADSLQRTWRVVEEKFGFLLPRLKWINLGGGHHITRPDYDVELLCAIIANIHGKYKDLTVYLEPGEAVALYSGVLVASVLDIVSTADPNLSVAILDTSATAHMPDVLEMPYRPQVFTNGNWATEAGSKYNYRLGGLTCLAGDVIGDYSFVEPLVIGQKLLFTDMAHYTMVKNTNFNGVRPPNIAIGNTSTGKVQVVKRFHYEDYKNRLS